MDSILSFTTLIAAILNYVWNLSLEGYLGAIISVIILKSAIDILRETVNQILGERPDKDLSKKIKEDVSSFEGVQGVYDLYLHNYGPSKLIASVHIQVENEMTAEQIHILTRKIEYKIFEKYEIPLTIGIYAANDKGEFGEIKKYLGDVIKNYKSILQLHGFYVDKVNNTVYFDIILSFEEKEKEKIKNEIISKMKEKYAKYNYNIIIDSDISD